MHRGFLWKKRGPVRAQNTEIELAIKECHPKSVRSDCVAMAFRDAVNQSFETKSSEVIGHLGGSVGGTKQGGYRGTKVTIPEASRKMGKGCKGLQERHDPGIAKAESGNTLSGLKCGSLHSIESVLGKNTLMADALYFEEFAIGLVPEIRQVR